jgi:hypothetical protein
MSPTLRGSEGDLGLGIKGYEAGHDSLRLDRIFPTLEPVH